MCEADDRNRQALFVLQTEWGCGRVDIGRIQAILRGDGREHLNDCDDCEECHVRTG
jgi:hypothetical protein